MMCQIGNKFVTHFYHRNLIITYQLSSGYIKAKLVQYSSIYIELMILLVMVIVNVMALLLIIICPFHEGYTIYLKKLAHTVENMNPEN